MTARAFRVLILTTLVVVLAAPSIVSAQTVALDELGTLGGMPNLGALVKEALNGRVPAGVDVDRLDNGMVQVTVPLPENARAPRDRDPSRCPGGAHPTQLRPPPGRRAPVAHVRPSGAWSQ